MKNITRIVTSTTLPTGNMARIMETALLIPNVR